MRIAFGSKGANIPDLKYCGEYFVFQFDPGKESHEDTHKNEVYQTDTLTEKSVPEVPVVVFFEVFPLFFADV